MALDDKKYEKFYKTDGSGDDKAKSADLVKAEALWELDRAEGCECYLSHPEYGPLICQMQQMQDEITSLRDEISFNKEKNIFPSGGVGISIIGSTFIIGKYSTISYNDNVDTTHALNFSMNSAGDTLTISNTLPNPKQKGTNVTKGIDLKLK